MRILILFFCIVFSASIGFVHGQNTLSESDLMAFISMNQSNFSNPGTVVIQEGNQNHAEIRGNQATVVQLGESHHFYYQESTLTPSNLQVNMEGENNYMEIIGNNQIMDNMSINLTGDNRSIIIRNFQ